MLVDADHVEAELLGVGELIEIGIVLGGAFFRIVKTVGQNHPGGAMFSRRFEIERPIWHQMKAGKFHVPARSRNEMTLPVTKSHCSICGLWPQASTMVICAPATRL